MNDSQSFHLFTLGAGYRASAFTPRKGTRPCRVSWVHRLKMIKLTIVMNCIADVLQFAAISYIITSKSNFPSLDFSGFY